ncbi:DUF5707 domain-containing protein [Streptomyces sp. NPDC059627]
MSLLASLSFVAVVLVLGGAGAFALGYAEDQPPALAHSTVRYTAPDGGRDGSLTFATEVTAPSDIVSMKVLAWAENSSLVDRPVTVKEMAQTESATCKSAGQSTTRCVYRAAVSAADAASSPHGTWHVAVLAMARDGRTILDTKAADFTVA